MRHWAFDECRRKFDVVPLKKKRNIFRVESPYFHKCVMFYYLKRRKIWMGTHNVLRWRNKTQTKRKVLTCTTRVVLHLRPLCSTYFAVSRPVVPLKRQKKARKGSYERIWRNRNRRRSFESNFKSRIIGIWMFELFFSNFMENCKSFFFKLKFFKNWLKKV